MRRNRNADCIGEPPGELTESATALRPLTAKARSSAAAWLAKDKAVRHWLGPITPSKRTTATLGGGWRKRSIGSSLRMSRGLITRRRWGLPRRGCRAVSERRLQHQCFATAQHRLGGGGEMAISLVQH